MASEQIVERLIELFNECTKTEIKDLVERREWGEINFKDAVPDLERLYTICNSFKGLPLKQLSDNVAQNILDQGESVKGVLSNIRDFSIIGQQDLESVRDGLIHALKQYINNFFDVSYMSIPYLAHLEGDTPQSMQNLTKSVDEVQGILDLIKKTAEDKTKEVDDIIATARAISGTAGITPFTDDFDTESKRLEESAKKWLWASIILSSATIITGVTFAFLQRPTLVLFDLIHYIATKVVILGVFATAAIWCGNIYKATMHQVRTNKFKANALRTFEAFNNAADDPAMRDAVLMEITKAIFNQGATGYISGESTKTGENTVLEIIRNNSRMAPGARSDN